MVVTIEKTFQGKVAVKSELTVVTLEDLIIFANKFGYTQQFEEFVADFQRYQNVTYRMGL